jgi:pyrroline-5-carboxylate reductase
MTSHITFIGGGNMASAIIGGLLRQGMTTQQIDVVEPYAEARDKLQAQFGITALHGPGPALAKASLVSGRSSRRPSRKPPCRPAFTPSMRCT